MTVYVWLLDLLYISDTAKPGDIIGLGQHGRQRDWLSSTCLWVMIGQEQPACVV